jgi:hypothetical protein
MNGCGGFIDEAAREPNNCGGEENEKPGLVAARFR